MKGDHSIFPGEPFKSVLLNFARIPGLRQKKGKPATNRTSPKTRRNVLRRRASSTRHPRSRAKRPKLGKDEANNAEWPVEPKRRNEFKLEEPGFCFLEKAASTMQGRRAPVASPNPEGRRAPGALSSYTLYVDMAELLLKPGGA